MEIKKLQQEYLSELVGALVIAGERDLSQIKQYRDLFSRIRLDKISDVSLRNRFIQLWDKIEPINLQDWTPEKPLAVDHIKATPLPQTTLSKIVTDDPLLFERAENEETTLFQKDAFWYGHEAYGKVADATQNQIIYGSVGSGRTALAKGLCHNESRWSNYFWIYLNVLPFSDNVVDILQYAAGEQLLNYVMSKPTKLFHLQEYQRHRIAVTLTQAFTASNTIAELERTKVDGQWWKASDNAIQQDVWQKVGNTQLDLLMQAIEMTEKEITMSYYQWWQALWGSFSSLNFKGVRLALDFMTGTVKTIEYLLPELFGWQNLGFITTLFMPEIVFQQIQSSLVDMQTIHLTWSIDSLDDLIKHRFSRIANCPVYAAFDPQGYDDFIDFEPRTPRQKIRLWQASLQLLDQTSGSITQDVLNRAKQNLTEKGEIEESQIESISLRQQITKSFNVGELKTLCFNLSIDYENLIGETKEDKVRELILLMRRKERFQALLNQCRELRPNISW